MQKKNPPGGQKADMPLKPREEATPKFNVIESPKDAAYPRWGETEEKVVFDTHVEGLPEFAGRL